MSVWAPSVQAYPKVSDLWGRKRLIFVQLYKLSLLVLTSPSPKLSPSCKGYLICPQNLGNSFDRAGKRLLSKVKCHHSYHKTKYGMNERTEPHSLISREADDCSNHSEAPSLSLCPNHKDAMLLNCKLRRHSRCHNAICSMFPKNW